MSTETAVTIAALKAHLKRGASNGQSAETLAFLVSTTPRAIRNLVDELIEEGTAVCAHPKTGYYIAETEAEVDATYNFLRRRALHGLKKASQLRNAFFNGGANPMQQLEDEGAFE